MLSRKPATTAAKFRCAVNIRGGDFTGGRVTSSMYRQRDSDAQSLRPGVQDAGVRESSRQESRVYPRCVSTSRHIQEFRDAHKSVHVYVQESKILESETGPRVHDTECIHQAVSRIPRHTQESKMVPLGARGSAGIQDTFSCNSSPRCDVSRGRYLESSGAFVLNCEAALQSEEDRAVRDVSQTRPGLQRRR